MKGAKAAGLLLGAMIISFVAYGEHWHWRSYVFAGLLGLMGVWSLVERDRSSTN